MALRKISTGAILAFVAIGLVLTVTTAGLLTISQTVESQGIVTAINLGVYSDSECTQTMTGIDWGNISPGDSVTKTIYVKNRGNAPITLSMNAENWIPSAASYFISVSWNRQGTVLEPEQSTSAALTLSVSSDINDVTEFYVEIVVTGSEQAT